MGQRARAQPPQPVWKIESGYHGYLWRWINKIEELTVDQDFYAAVHVTLDLIDTSPNDVRAQFNDAAKQIRTILRDVRPSGGAPFMLIHRTNKRRQLIARTVFYPLRERLLSYLDKKGYLERRRRVTESNVPTELQTIFGQRPQ